LNLFDNDVDTSSSQISNFCFIIKVFDSFRQIFHISTGLSEIVVVSSIG